MDVLLYGFNIDVFAVERIVKGRKCSFCTVVRFEDVLFVRMDVICRHFVDRVVRKMHECS